MHKIVLICLAFVAASSGFPQGLGRFFVPQSQVDELKADEGLVHQVRDAIEPVAVPAAAGPCPNPAYQTTIQPPSGGIICVNEWSINEQGCTVGPSGEMVCPQGNVGAGGDSVTFRGNKGHRGTGSNGNASPVGGNGLPVDPAAVTYLKQIEQYQGIYTHQEAQVRTFMVVPLRVHSLEYSKFPGNEFVVTRLDAGLRWERPT